MTRSELRAVWETRISDCRASGQSVVAWCAAHQINPRQYYYWLRKLSNTEMPSPRWLEVCADQQPSNETDSCLQVKIGSAVIEVKPGFNRDLLADVVLALQTIC